MNVMNLGKSPSRRQEKIAESLIKQCKDKSWLIRAKAAISLGRLGDHVTVPTLIQALSDENYLVRYHAAEALKQIGTPEAVRAAKVWERNDRD